LTVINTVSVVQGVLKFTANVLRALLSDETVKVTGVPAVTTRVVGVTCKFIGA
jgi:hypothetical protein